jgi:hypothetical protein
MYILYCLMLFYYSLVAIARSYLEMPFATTTLRHISQLLIQAPCPLQ